MRTQDHGLPALTQRRRMRDHQTRRHGPCSRVVSALQTSSTNIDERHSLLGTGGHSGKQGSPGPTATVQRQVQRGGQGLEGPARITYRSFAHSFSRCERPSVQWWGTGVLRRNLRSEPGPGSEVRSESGGKLPHLLASAALWPVSAHRPGLRPSWTSCPWKVSCLLLFLHAVPGPGPEGLSSPSCMTSKYLQCE